MLHGMPAPTDLENAVLGLIKLKGPCTPYAIRRMFADSPSSYWNGSAGAIYPAMERLEQRGLVKSVRKLTGKRAAREYQTTPKGLAELRKWLRPPLPESAALMDMDPVRLRVRFLGVLQPSQRAKFLAEATAKLREQTRVMDKLCDESRESGDIYRYLTRRGALLSLRYQLDFLAEVKDTLAHSDQALS